MSKAQNKRIDGPGLEKKGGYPSPKKPLSQLPKVPAGPAPGAQRPTGAR